MSAVQTTKMSNFRWVICALLFLATTVNYMDRQVLSLTWKDFIAPEFHWNDNDYGTITGWFSIFYAIANLFAGKFIDWMGTKKGYLIAIFVWSTGAVLHAGCGWVAMNIEGYDSIEALRMVQAGSDAAVAIATISVWLFLSCRMILALGEAGNFPAAIKVTAEYFPKKDRAFATSIFNSGASVGALAAPATIPLLARAWGWEMAFIIIGALGFIWMALWVWLYEKPAKNPRVNQAELNYIEQDNDLAIVQNRDKIKEEKSIPFFKCFTFKQTWSFLVGKFIDLMGTKKGYLIAIFVWSVGACLHAACGWTALGLAGGSITALTTISVWLFLACRMILAVGEAGNFPAAIKATAEYFPKKDRAFSTSIFNSGASVGALAAPATIPLLARAWGWEMAFIIIGGLGFIWMALWVFIYDKPNKSKHVNAAELTYILSLIHI